MGIKYTKKGILIVHWDYDFPIIRKAKLICEKTENNKDNYLKILIIIQRRKKFLRGK